MNAEAAIANADQIIYWNEVAGPKWVANQERLERLMMPLTAALLDGAAADRGEAVVDVGCGCGGLALRLAEQLGPGGRVQAVDISEPMLAHARERDSAAGPGRAPIDWRRADAMTHAFEPGFDLIVSRFGVMFFEDRARAFANLRRALKPGGRLAILTWRSRAEVEWMQAPLDWIASVLPPPDDMDGAVGPFAMADEEVTCEMLAAAGFGEVVATRVDRPLTIGVGIDDAAAMLCDTGPAARLMRDAEPKLRREAEVVLREKLQHHLIEGRVEMGGACWLYRGKA